MAPKIPYKHRQSNFFSVCETCSVGCCNGARPPLTLKRKRTIQSFLKAKDIFPSNLFEHEEYAFPRETHDGYCIFFDKLTRRCRIHPVKPETCVAGPITFDINRQSRRIEWFIKTGKICTLAAVLYRDKESLEKHIKSARSEILRLVHDLDSQALRAILGIQEPDTFKIGEDALDQEVISKLRQ